MKAALPQPEGRHRQIRRR